MADQNRPPLFFVNCPHCSEVVEAVCPREKQYPRSVRAYKERSKARGSRFLDCTRSSTACPACRKTIWLRWCF